MNRGETVLQSNGGINSSTHITSIFVIVCFAFSGITFAEMPELQLSESETAELAVAVVDPDFVPAKLRNDNYSLADAIEFPRSGSDDDIVFSIACNTPVDRQGNLWRRGDLIKPPSPEHNSYCIGDGEESGPYERKVIEALKRARMEPAKVDGKKTSVSMKFTVIFRRISGQEEIYVVPNWYLNQDELGINYYAPQVVQNSVLKNSSPRCLNRDVLLRVVVNNQGLITSATHHLGKISKKCLSRTIDWVESWEFIPGTVNGISTEMPFLITVGRSLDVGIY